MKCRKIRRSSDYILLITTALTNIYQQNDQAQMIFNNKVFSFQSDFDRKCLLECNNLKNEKRKEKTENF